MMISTSCTLRTDAATQPVCCIPSLPVSNNELTLPTANGDQAIHGFDASLHWLPHRDTGDDARGLQTHTSAGFRAKGTLLFTTHHK